MPDVQEGKAPPIIRYILDAKPCHAAKENAAWETVNWERSSLRDWLNDDFLNAAFSPDEQTAILVTEVDNSEAQSCFGWEAKPGMYTQDRRILLSFREADELYSTEETVLVRAPTDYAITHGVYTGGSLEADGRTIGFWWLRTSITSHDDQAGCVAGSERRFF